MFSMSYILYMCVCRERERESERAREGGRDRTSLFVRQADLRLSRFNAEQEQGRQHILNELLVNKKFPDDLWEDIFSV